MWIQRSARGNQLHLIHLQIIWHTTLIPADTLHSAVSTSEDRTSGQQPDATLANYWPHLFTADKNKNKNKKKQLSYTIKRSLHLPILQISTAWLGQYKVWMKGIFSPSVVQLIFVRRFVTVGLEKTCSRHTLVQLPRFMSQTRMSGGSQINSWTQERSIYRKYLLFVPF